MARKKKASDKDPAAGVRVRCLPGIVYVETEEGHRLRFPDIYKAMQYIRGLRDKRIVNRR